MLNFEKNISKIWKLSTYISDIFLFGILILAVVNVMMRRLFNAPIFGVTELVCYGSLASAAFGLAQTEWLDGNVRMTLILEKTGVKFGCILNLLVNIVGTCGFTYVSCFLIKQAVDKFSTGHLSSELRFPMYIVTGILAIGFALLAVALLTKVILYAKRIKNKQYSIEPPTSENKPEEEGENL